VTTEETNAIPKLIIDGDAARGVKTLVHAVRLSPESAVDAVAT